MSIDPDTDAIRIEQFALAESRERLSAAMTKVLTRGAAGRGQLCEAAGAVAQVLKIRSRIGW
jgi:hypothetical protein